MNDFIAAGRLFQAIDSQVALIVILFAKMAYHRFEDVPVWKDATELARAIFEFTSDGLFRNHAGLSNRLERAAISISNNIAEGF
jgi:hypothetical protein